MPGLSACRRSVLVLSLVCHILNAVALCRHLVSYQRRGGRGGSRTNKGVKLARTLTQQNTWTRSALDAQYSHMLAAEVLCVMLLCVRPFSQCMPCAVVQLVQTQRQLYPAQARQARYLITYAQGSR